MSDTKYIHTFKKEEQDRLIGQAELVAPFVHRNIDFSDASNILEIGCGVGAQLKILCRKYPQAAMHGVDISDSQIKRAESLLATEKQAGRVTLNTAPATELPYEDNTFDAIFICFVLEHLVDPVAAVIEAKRVLKDGGVLICTEVFNDALYIYPASPAIMQYWDAFNKMQIDIGGDPNIGIRLCNIMLQAGLEVHRMDDASYMVDRRISDQTERARYFDHWYANFMSAKDQLIDSGRISVDLIKQFEQEYSVIRDSDDAVFLYSNRQVSGKKVK